MSIMEMFQEHGIAFSGMFTIRINLTGISYALMFLHVVYQAGLQFKCLLTLAAYLWALQMCLLVIFKAKYGVP